MRNFVGIRYAQTQLLEILTSDEYKQGTLTQEKQEQLDALIEFCGAYEKHREIQEMCDHDFEHYWNMMDGRDSPSDSDKCNPMNSRGFLVSGCLDE
tara:strand:- start:177 stop:464 length:288 start_codon:yes stop_codon:yes gene_type:complete